MNSVLHPCGFFSLTELNEAKPVLQYCKWSIFSQICLVLCTFVIPLKMLLLGLISDKIECKFCVQRVQIFVSFNLETMTTKFKRWFLKIMNGLWTLVKCINKLWKHFLIVKDNCIFLFCRFCIFVISKSLVIRPWNIFDNSQEKQT